MMFIKSGYQGPQRYHKSPCRGPQRVCERLCKSGHIRETTTLQRPIRKNRKETPCIFCCSFYCCPLWCWRIWWREASDREQGRYCNMGFWLDILSWIILFIIVLFLLAFLIPRILQIKYAFGFGPPCPAWTSLGRCPLPGSQRRPLAEKPKKK